jgi:hypothetical protein
MSFIRDSRISQSLKQALNTEEDVQDRFLAAEDDELDTLSENLTLKIDNQEVVKPSRGLHQHYIYINELIKLCIKVRQITEK